MFIEELYFYYIKKPCAKQEKISLTYHEKNGIIIYELNMNKKGDCYPKTRSFMKTKKTKKFGG